MEAPVVRLEDVSKHYVQDEDALAALDGVSISVESGEFIGIMGRSGSGKTTLLNLVGGLDRAYSGTVEVLGKDLNVLKDTELSLLRNESIGFVFQSYHLLPQLSCAENVGLPALFKSGKFDGMSRRIDEVLSKVGLEKRRSDPPTSLSGGQKQRIAIARALLMKPKLLLCDEPTGNLDKRTGHELIESLRELSKSEVITVVVVTHEEHISTVCDRIIRLQDGRIVPEIEENDTEEESDS